MSNKLISFANNVQNRVDNVDPSKQQVFIDPVTAYQIIKVISEVVSMIKNCMTPKEVVEVAVHPSPYHKRRVRAAVRRQMGGFGFWRKGDRVVEEIIKEAKKQTVQDVEMMYVEVEQLKETKETE